MKIVDIVTSEMHQLHGANKVTEKLILGREIFAKHGIQLRNLYSNDGIIACDKYVSKLGNHLQTAEYKKSRSRIETLKKIPIYKSLFIQTLLNYNEYKANAKAFHLYKESSKKPDFVIFQDPYTALYFFKHGWQQSKSILISHADTDPLEQLLIGRPSIRGSKVEEHLRKDFDILFHSVDKVITICQSSRQYMWDTYALDCPCIINGIEDYVAESAGKLSNKDGRIHVCDVASVQYRKGQDIIVEAMHDMERNYTEQIAFHVFGEGENLQALKDMTKKYQLDQSVIFHGAVRDIQNYLPMMDAFVFPSRADTVPIAIIEAMRAGLPIFASDVGEISYMINDCGVLISPNTEDVRKLLENIADSNYDFATMGNDSRKRYEEIFSLEAMISKYASEINR